MNYLIVVDMQIDFVSGALGTKEAQAIVGKVAGKIRAFDGRIIFTRDTLGGFNNELPDRRRYAD